MPASKTQQKVTNKYISKAYDKNLTIAKGHNAEIKVHADKQNENLNSFINRAINVTTEKG